MRYNEWITQLNANLLNVSEEERRRVIDYYAEAYADRRAAGFSETEIIDGFGAPYDAAQLVSESENSQKNETTAAQPPLRSDEPVTSCQTSYPKENESNQPETTEKRTDRARGKNDNAWVVLLLCILFAVPLTVLFAIAAAIIICILIAPLAAAVIGIMFIVSGITYCFSIPGAGLATCGTGLIILGAGILLVKVDFLLIKYIRKAAVKMFGWFTGLFRRERA